MASEHGFGPFWIYFRGSGHGFWPNLDHFRPFWTYLGLFQASEHGFDPFLANIGVCGHGYEPFLANLGGLGMDLGYQVCLA